MDQMGYFRWPQPAHTWAKAAPDPAPLASLAGENNRQWRIIGALNALTGRVDYLDDYIVGRQKVIAMYHHLDEVYAHAKCIFVIQDNWSIHTHPDVLEALTDLPRIKPVWLPTYSPWLNPIEKLWRWLRQDVLKMHRLAADWDELRRRVNTFLDQFAAGSQDLLRYVGLLGDGKMARAVRSP
jgi:transposase